MAYAIKKLPNGKYAIVKKDGKEVSKPNKPDVAQSAIAARLASEKK